MNKEILKNIIREEIKPYKKLLGEGGGKVLHGGLAGQEMRQSAVSSEINKLGGRISKEQARKLTGLKGITPEQKSDFIRWVMMRFGKNMPKDITDAEVEKAIFSDNSSEYKTLNLTIDNPDTLAKMYQTKIKLNKELGSTVGDKTEGSSRMNNLLAQYDDAYAAEDKARGEVKKTKGGRDENLSTFDTGGEEFDKVAPIVGVNSKQRADQLFQTARGKFFARSIIGAGSLNGMADIMEDVAFDAAKIWTEILVGAVKLALEDRNSRDAFSAIDFVEGINSILGLKPDYSVPESEMSNEELTAIQAYGDELYEALRIKNTAGVNRIKTEIIRALVDDIRGTGDKTNFLNILASVIRYDQTKEVEGKNLGYGPSRVAKQKIEKNLEKIADLESSDTPKAKAAIAALEAENEKLQQQINTVFDSMHQKLSKLATEIAELEAEALFYSEIDFSGRIGKEKENKKKADEIASQISAKEKQMKEIREEMNTYVPEEMTRIKLKYSGGNVVKTFQNLVAKMTDKNINSQLTDEEKRQVEAFIEKKVDLNTLSPVEND